MGTSVCTEKNAAGEATRRPEETDIPELVDHKDGQVYPRGSTVSVKTVAFLYAYRRMHPYDIVARFPKTLTHAKAHLALVHYYLNKERIDAEIAADLERNTKDALSRAEGGLPRVGLASLVEVAKDSLNPQENDRDQEKR